MGIAPTLFPLVLLVALALKPSPQLWAYTLLYFGHSVLAFGHFNTAYLRQATPVHYLWVAPLLEIILPLQLLAAIGSRQRIVWREHVMQVERGGTFHFVRRSSRSSAKSVGD